MDASQPDRLAAIRLHASDVFGTEAKADRWLHTRLDALGQMTPEEIMDRDPIHGFDEVQELLP
jgi:uncharacterized protein (DUF2384 family)